MSRRSATRGIALVLALAFVVWFAIREVRDRSNRERAFPVVGRLGGRIGSIGYWPFGEEIRISFANRSYSREELRRLTVLTPLADRHWVGVAFVDTNLNRDDVLYLRRLLPDCVVFRVVDGETVRD